MNPELAKQLNDSPLGQALRDFIVSELEKLDSIQTIPLASHQLMGEQALSRQIAYLALKEMFDPLIGFSQFDILKEKDKSISTEMLLPERSPQDNQE